ncbi:hypothetical protein [Oscillatoria sp. FACHB-1406]|uniref:hypothetical protein n=1 Tax=Oscillatoria sp. FACHB-1406 TaxID=2692846 RepID=UPI0016849086|nr:hypothetical protein [Oscillatoria sp. FACHB-1406]MBD2578325.1 hypothetical protein [Oscillatoria sp. FACHB-1406]
MTPKTTAFRSIVSVKPALVPSLGLSAALVFASCGLARPAAAQLTPNAPSQGYQNNEIDNFTGLEQGNFNPMDWILRSTMGPQRTLSEFQQDGNKKLDNATAEFRRQQAELFQQQRPTPNNPATSESQTLPLSQ